MPVARIAPTRPMRMPVTAAPPPTNGPKRLSASPSSCISSPLGRLWALPPSPPPPAPRPLSASPPSCPPSPLGRLWALPSSPPPPGRFSLRRVATPTTRPKTGTATTATTAKRIRDARAMLKMKLLLRYGRWEGRDPVGSRPDSILCYFRRFLMALLALSAPLPEPPVRFLPFLSPETFSLAAFVAASLILLPTLAMLAPFSEVRVSILLRSRLCLLLHLLAEGPA